MDSIIARDWFKYLNVEDISRVALIGRSYAQTVRNYLPEIVQMFALRKNGQALVRAAIRAGKNELLEAIGANIPFKSLFGSWALELGNPDFAETCLAQGWYLIPLMYEKAILTMNELICRKLRFVIYGEQDIIDYLRYLRIKYPMFGSAAVFIPFNLREIYGAAAAFSGNLRVIETISGNADACKGIYATLAKNKNKKFVLDALNLCGKHFSLKTWKKFFKAAHAAGNKYIVELLSGGFQGFDKMTALGQATSLYICDVRKVVVPDYLFDHNYAIKRKYSYVAYKLNYRPNIDYLLKKQFVSPDSAFLGACRSGNVDLIKETLALRPEFEILNVFYHLGKSNNLEAIKYILKNVDPGEFYPVELLNAALEGQAKVGGSIVNELIDLGAEINEDDEDLLCKFIESENWKNIEIIIDRGFDSAKVFHNACIVKKYDIIHKLFESDIEIDYFPLTFEVKNSTQNIMIKKLFEELGLEYREKIIGRGGLTAAKLGSVLPKN